MDDDWTEVTTKRQKTQWIVDREDSNPEDETPQTEETKVIEVAEVKKSPK